MMAEARQQKAERKALFKEAETFDAIEYKNATAAKHARMQMLSAQGQRKRRSGKNT